VIQHEGEVQAQPQVGTATDCAAARLSRIQIRPNAVIAPGAYMRVGGFEPEFCSSFLPGQLLACIAAEDLLAALK
jgi:hypothetical protein